MDRNSRKTAKFCLAAADERLIPPGTHVLAAFSGGADSAVLLHWLAGQELTVTAAHLHHGIRGEAADRDEAFCRRFCADLGVPLIVGHEDVPAYAAATGRSTEDAARELRYAFLERARKQCGAELIAVAHHRDDRAETVLLNLLRGSGAAGLSAMKKSRGNIVRPLLACGRDDIIRYAAAHGVDYVTDETNACTDYRRNLLRSLAPQLSRINSAFGENLCRAAELIEEDDHALTRMAISALARALTKDGLITAEVCAQYRAVASRMLRLYALQAGIDRDLTRRHTDALYALCEKGTGSCDLPLGRQARVHNGRLRIGLPYTPPADYCVPLALRGATAVPGGRILAEPAQTAQACDLYTCFLPEALAQGAVLRLRRPGDRIVPFGSSSAKKLKDVYIARKCTPQQKDLPVLEKDGVLLWAVGAAAAEQCRTAAGMPVLRLRYEPINEGGKTNA